MCEHPPMSQFITTSRWRRWALNTLGILGACALVFEIYTRYPSSVDVRPLNFPADTARVILLFHGTDGRDEPLLTEIAQRMAAESAAETGTVVLRYIWSPHSDNQFRASAHGSAIGRALGRELAGLARLSTMRLIGHSAGAYLMDPLCQAYKSATAKPARVEMTFIDPIGIVGGWDFGYGYRNHGRCANFAAAYINLDDIVPGTNAALQQAYNYDLTHARARRAFDGRGHIWPVKYFLDEIIVAGGEPDEYSHRELPRGTIRRID
jgi:hypothetical protein